MFYLYFKLIYQGLRKKKVYITTGKRNSSSCYNNSSCIMFNTCTYFFHNFILQHTCICMYLSLLTIDSHVFTSVISCLLKACTCITCTDIQKYTTCIIYYLIDYRVYGFYQFNSLYELVRFSLGFFKIKFGISISGSPLFSPYSCISCRVSEEKRYIGLIMIKALTNC